MNAPVVLTAGGAASTKNKKANKKSKSVKINTPPTNGGDEEEGPSTPRMGNGTPGGSSHNNNNNNATTSNSTGAPSIPTANNVGEFEMDRRRRLSIQHASVKLDDLYAAPPAIPDESEAETANKKTTEYFWLAFCFFGIMGSFVCYGLLLEYATSGGKHLHELSFLFVTSLLYTMTASVGRYARAEKPSTIPPAQFAVLGLTSMGSTFCSVRALRYVIYPIQVLAKSCKPVPVMLMGALMGKKYPPKKYVKVVLIVGGVGLFMGGG